MKYFLDENGNPVEEPEGLVDRLSLESPELADRLEDIGQNLAVMHAYCNFLYSVPQNNDPSKGRDFEAFVDSQQGLRSHVGSYEGIKLGGMDITGDRVAVFRADRPLVHVFKDGANCVCDAFVGDVESYDVTDIEGSDFCSGDGKIHRRLVLNNATRLSEELVNEWWGAVVTGQMYKDARHLPSECVKKLKSIAPGKERVIVYDKYPNVDFELLHHVPKGVEKLVAGISYEQAELIDVSAFLPPWLPKVDTSFFCSYNEPWRYNIVMEGEDTRPIPEIEAEVIPYLAGLMQPMFGANIELEHGDVGIMKLAKNRIPPEKIALIDSAPSDAKPKLYSLFIKEFGMELTDTTLIEVNMWEKGMANDEARMQLLAGLEKLLTPRGYKRTKKDVSRCATHFYAGKVDTRWHFVTDCTLYFGKMFEKRHDNELSCYRWR